MWCTAIGRARAKAVALLRETHARRISRAESSTDRQVDPSLPSLTSSSPPVSACGACTASTRISLWRRRSSRSHRASDRNSSAFCNDSNQIAASSLTHPVTGCSPWRRLRCTGSVARRAWQTDDNSATKAAERCHRGGCQPPVHRPRGAWKSRYPRGSGLLLVTSCVSIHRALL